MCLKEKIVGILLPTVCALLIFLQQSCKEKSNGYPQIIGTWVSYKEEKGGEPLPFLDSMMVDTGIEWHLEFGDDGKVTEWWVPEESFDYEFAIKDSLLTYKNKRFVITRVDQEELVLDELDTDEVPGALPRSPYREKTFFKRVTSDGTKGQ